MTFSILDATRAATASRRDATRAARDAGRGASANARSSSSRARGDARARALGDAPRADGWNNLRIFSKRRDVVETAAVARERGTMNQPAPSMGDMEFDMLFEEDAMDFERDRTPRRDDGATTVGFDVSAVVVRTARLLCTPRGEEAYRTLKALKWAVREIGLDAFKDDSRVSHVRESGLEELMMKLRENDPVKFGRLERATSETPREGDVSDALKKLNHSFLWLPPSVLIGDSDAHALAYASADERIIIEPNLRSHFVVGRATAQYARLVESMPTAFVGTYAQLSEIVFFMSTHMINSFRESGLDIPPWRRPSALTSKWTVKSEAVARVSISPSGSPVAPFDFPSAVSHFSKPSQIARAVVRAL